MILQVFVLWTISKSKCTHNVNILVPTQRSTEHKVNYEKELKSEGIVSDEDTPYVSEEEKAESVCRLLVLEIPQRTLLADPSQVYLMCCFYQAICLFQIF